MKIKQIWPNVRRAWNILLGRPNVFYVEFTPPDGRMTDEEVLRSAAFLAAVGYFNRHDSVSSNARTEIVRALLCDHDILAYTKSPDGSHRALYACDTPETLSELRALDFDTDTPDTQDIDHHGTDNDH